MKKPVTKTNSVAPSKTLVALMAVSKALKDIINAADNGAAYTREELTGLNGDQYGFQNALALAHSAIKAEKDEETANENA